MTKILITGSRDATDDMIVGAEKITRRLIKLRHYVIVGDADGIDDAVIRTANLLKYERISVYGAYSRMKRKTDFGKNIPTDGTYPYRDELMALETRVCLSIWNGRSRGTRITFECAKRLNKPVYHMWTAPIGEKTWRIG